MIRIRVADEIFSASGKAEHGRFEGKWNLGLDSYAGPEHERFGALRIFNDDTLSPGAAWPMHSHRDTEMVVYCAEGEFRHFDNKGHEAVLKKGWVQHVSIGRGMWHSEANNLQDRPLRLVQMWFAPERKGVEPRYERKPVNKGQRTNKLLPLVSNGHLGALKINADAEVFSSFLRKGKCLRHHPGEGRGIFAYVLEGGPVTVNGSEMTELSSAEIRDERSVEIVAVDDAELLLVDVRL